jgi:predicted transcriptional regulator
MRTTLDLDEALLRRAKRLAAERHTTLTRIVEEALAAALAPRAAGASVYRFRWETDHGRYVGGIDLADRDALYEVMEGRR